MPVAFFVCVCAGGGGGGVRENFLPVGALDRRARIDLCRRASQSWSFVYVRNVQKSKPKYENILIHKNQKQ